MVDFNVNTVDGDTAEFEGRPCFGDLSDTFDSLSWKLGKTSDYFEGRLTSVDYLHGDKMRFKSSGYGFNVYKWVEEHPIFGKAFLSDSDGVVTVSADAPADVMLGTLSLARSFGRSWFTDFLKESYEIFKHKEYCVYLAELHDRCGHDVFSYREESIVCPFTVKEFIAWIHDPIKAGGGGCEDSFNQQGYYDSVKSGIHPCGKRVGFGRWNDRVQEDDQRKTLNVFQLISFLEYEGELHG